MATQQTKANRFEWRSSSPSPAEVAALSAHFADVLEVPGEALAAETSVWESVGMLARSIGRWFPPEAFVRELRRAGISGDLKAIGLAKLCYLIKFASPEDRAIALARPWTVNGQPVAVAQWRPDFFPAEDALPAALLWIRLPGLPIEYWSAPALRAVVAAAGDFIEADQWTLEQRRGSYARVAVRVNISAPLRPGALIRGSKGVFWQQYTYENVDGICPECGSLHISGQCNATGPPRSSSAAPTFGPWMAALRQRKPAVPPDAEAHKPSSAPPSSSAPSGPDSLADRKVSSGWQKPTKTTRRRTAPLSAVIVADLPEPRQVLGSVCSESAASLAPRSVTPAGVPGSEGSCGDPSEVLPGLKIAASSPRIPAGSSSPSSVILPSPAKRPRKAPRASKQSLSPAAKGKGKSPAVVQAAPVSLLAPPSPPPASIDRNREFGPSGQPFFRFGEGRGLPSAVIPAVTDHPAMVASLKLAILGSDAPPSAAGASTSDPQCGLALEPLQMDSRSAQDATPVCSPTAHSSDMVISGPMEGAPTPLDCL